MNIVKLSMIKIAVSKCLLGEQVRYDGTDRLCKHINAIINDSISLVPFCPEVAIGMGIPRAPIQLDMIGTTINARRVNNPTEDFTEALTEYANKFVNDHPDLVAVINKKGSPSCGFRTTKLYIDNVLQHSQASGIFLREITSLLPDLVTIDEIDLADSDKKQIFLEAIHKKSPQ